MRNEVETVLKCDSFSPLYQDHPWSWFILRIQTILVWTLRKQTILVWTLRKQTILVWTLRKQTILV